MGRKIRPPKLLNSSARAAVSVASLLPPSRGNFLVRTDEGENYKVFYSPNTRIMKERQPIDANEIHLGDELIAAGQLDRKAKTLGAVLLLDVDAAEVRKARQGLGKTWTAGKVRSVRDLTITIDVIDGKQTQIVSVDENTSFQRHNESVTLRRHQSWRFHQRSGSIA